VWSVSVSYIFTETAIVTALAVEIKRGQNILPCAFVRQGRAGKRDWCECQQSAFIYGSNKGMLSCDWPG
jgi:hypothetical protein